MNLKITKKLDNLGLEQSDFSIKPIEGNDDNNQFKFQLGIKAMKNKTVTCVLRGEQILIRVGGGYVTL